MGLFQNLLGPIVKRIAERSIQSIGGTMFVKVKTLILQYGCGNVDKLIKDSKGQYDNLVATLIAWDIPGIDDSIEAPIDVTLKEGSILLWSRIEKGAREFADKVCSQPSDEGPRQLFGAADRGFDDEELLAMAEDDTIPE